MMFPCSTRCAPHARRLWVAVPTLVGLALTVASLPACSNLGVDSPRSGGTSGVGSLAAGSITPPVPGIQVEILSPVRASFQSPGRMTLTGMTTPSQSTSAPITEVVIDGLTLPVQPDGSFSTDIDLLPGMNVIGALARDSRGETGSTTISVLAGEWNPPNQVIPAAISLRINDASLDALASIGEDTARTLDMSQLTTTPLYQNRILGLLDALATMHNPRFTDTRVVFDSQPDGLHFLLELIDPAVEVQVQASMFGRLTMGPEIALVGADSVLVTGRIVLSVLPDGRLGVSVEDVTVDFVRFYATFPTSPLMSLVAPLFRGLIQGRLENELANGLALQAADMQQELDNALTPAQPLTVLNKPFGLDVRAESVAFDHLGFGMQLQYNSPPVLGTTPRAQAAPGSFRTPGGMPAPTSPRSTVISMDDDTINRALYAAWAGGLLDMDMSPQGLLQQNITMPNGGITAADVGALLPELLTVASPSAPMSVRIETGLPPLLQVTGAPDMVELSLGEVYLEMLVDRGGGTFETFFRIALHVRIGATVVVNQGGIRLSSAQNADIRVDLLDTPMVDLDERRIQVLLITALTPLLPRLINSVNVIPLPPQIQQLTLFDMRAWPDGPARDHLSVGLDMLR